MRKKIKKNTVLTTVPVEKLQYVICLLYVKVIINYSF